MTNSRIFWFHLFLISFPTTLFLRYAEAERQKGLVWELLRRGRLTEALGLKDLLRTDPIAKLEIEQLIQHYGYPVEVHRFYAPDGYVTTLHRIPHGRNSTQRGGFPVLLQHGLLSTGISWLHSDLSSLPFQLADRGFDVFISSQRGSMYSLGHKTLKITDKAYWKFGMDEIANIEIPAFVDYILAVTGAAKVHYVGFSLGTMLLFMFLSGRPEYNDKIDRVSLMGTAGYFSNTKSPLFRILRSLGPKAVQGLMDVTFSGGFGLPNVVLTLLSPVCNLALGPLVCGSTVFLLSGDNAAHGNYTRTGRFIKHVSSVSARVLAQLLQWMKTPGIARLNFGPEENIKKYGTPDAPVYNLRNLRRPLQAFIAPQDNIATPGDAYKTLKEIGEFFVNLDTSLVNDPEFNHIDFMVHDNIYNLVYKDVVNFFVTGNPSTRSRNPFGFINVEY